MSARIREQNEQEAAIVNLLVDEPNIKNESGIISNGSLRLNNLEDVLSLMREYTQEQKPLTHVVLNDLEGFIKAKEAKARKNLKEEQNKVKALSEQ